MERVTDISSVEALSATAEEWKARAVAQGRVIACMDSLISYQRKHLKELVDELEETAQGYRDLAARVAAIEKERDALGVS